MFSANSSQVSDDKLFVEDVFSTWLYTGNDATNNITNGIDLTGKGGMVWLKNRASSSYAHFLFDTSRGAGYALQSNTTGAQQNYVGYQTFGSSGFSVIDGTALNVSPNPYVSWSFREAPKFFDVVTWTGNGAENRVLSHALGTVPGTMIIKRTDSSGNWDVWHRAFSYYLGTAPSVFCMGRLEETTQLGYSEAQRLGAAPTSTSFTLGPNVNGAPLLNASGGTYVAYLFAHDTTSDGIIQCGSYTGTGAAGNFVSLGWEPQWVLIKRASGGTGDWRIIDNMRGLVTNTTNGDATLNANTSEAEFNDATVGNYPFAAANPTGFTLEATSGPSNASGSTYIYIAIRRGPMRTPTSGTSVFSPVTRTGTGGLVDVSVPITTDLVIIRNRSGSSAEGTVDRLRGLAGLETSDTTQEQKFEPSSSGYDLVKFNQTGYTLGQGYWANLNGSGTSYVDYNFRRAPSFFDEVCYTGTGSALSVSHNLGVIPDIVIIKRRDSANQWVVMCPVLGYDGSGNVRSLFLNLDNAAGYSVLNNNSTITSSSIPLVGGGFAQVNASGGTYVAYLFASCPGVSKVGTYTGNGSSQTINCGFAAGARFVMIKRASAAGDWYVWDSARGIVAGNDPRLSLNTTAAEVTTDDSVDTDSSGFVVNQLSATNVNVNAATYIFMAVA
jgi:hypothetical protein